MNWYEGISKNNKTITLNSDEKYIFDFLKYLIGMIPSLSGLEMRVAGGWVRDKLLAQPSDDIDIALSFSKKSDRKITGEDFVRYIEKASQYVTDSPIIDTWFIAADESKAKNIAPAAIKLKAPSGNIYKIEFVNLRTEEYDENSRVPRADITNDPSEDAQRRDLTINSLFYNIGDKNIEDYVGGVEDLKNMRIKTPLDPKKTFIDDPLRMLRVLRFYSKYPNAKLDKSILDALSDNNVQSSYDKLSPERSSVELLKMLKGDRAVDASKILFETGLYRKVFKIPEDYLDIDMDQKTPYHNLTLLNHTLKVMNGLDNISKREDIPNDERAYLLLSGMMHDFGKMSREIQQPHPKDPSRMRYIGHDRASADFAKDILTQMGFAPEVKSFVDAVIRNHMFLHQFKDGKIKEKSIGKFLSKVGDYYKYIIHHGEADSLGRDIDSDDDVSRIVNQYTDFRNQINNYKTEMSQPDQNMISNPLLDGNEIDNIVQQYAPELIKNKAFINIKDKKVFYIKYLINKLLEAQWSREVSNRDQAENFIQSAVKNLLNLWKSQSKKGIYNENKLV